MTKYTILGAAIILSTAIAAPASAWEAVSWPGAYQSIYPNADVLGYRSGRPTDALALQLRSDSVAKPHKINRTPTTKRN